MTFVSTFGALNTRDFPINHFAMDLFKAENEKGESKFEGDV